MGRRHQLRQVHRVSVSRNPSDVIRQKRKRGSEAVALPKRAGCPFAWCKNGACQAEGNTATDRLAARVTDAELPLNRCVVTIHVRVCQYSA